MTENGTTAALEPNEKQKKILAAKKKLKSFQAKRAAAAVTPADDDSAGAEPVGGVNGEAHADTDAAGGDNAQVQSRDDEADDLAKELEQLKLQINAERKHLEDEHKKTRAELQSSRDAHLSLEASAAAREKELSELVEGREREIQGLKDDAQRAQIEAAQAIEDAHDLHRRQLAEREAQLTDERTVEATKFTNAIEERDSRLAELVHSAEKAGTAHSLEIVQMTEAAQAAADTAAAKAEQDQRHIADLDSKLAAETERANAGEVQCAELVNKQNELEASMQDLEANVAAKQAALDEAHINMEETQTSHQEELQNASKQAETAKAEHQAQVLSLNEDIADLEREKGKQEARVAELEAEVASLNETNNGKSQRIDGLETDLAHVSRVRDTIQTKHDKLVAAQKESRKTIDRLFREKAEVGEALTAMEQAKESIATQARTDKEEYAAEKAALDSAVDGLQTRVHALEAQVEDSNSKLENERNTCAQLDDEKQQAEAEIARVTNEAEAEHQRLDELHVQAQAKIAKLEEDLQIEAEAAKEAFEEL
ncbi:hypothetical protein LPJ81_003868, partial [Coemansia sp. IMI 209127]